jgi:hypothetical protein
MTRHCDSSIPRIVAGTLLCSLAASMAWAPRRGPGSAQPPDGGGRVVVVWTRPADGASTAPVSADVDKAVPVAAHSFSQAFRERETGRFVEPTPDQRLDAGPQRLRAALSTSSEDLVEEPVAASPGGVRVSLRGRFRSAVAAERRPDGSLAVECGEPAAGAAQVLGPAPPPPPTSSRSQGGAR